jgi:hypothetical protein
MRQIFDVLSWFSFQKISAEGDSLFKGHQLSSNHVSRSIHQLNRILCAFFSRIPCIMFLHSFWSGIVYVSVAKL